METIKLDEKYVLEYIRDMLASFKTISIQPKDIEYHHNCSYDNVPSILKHGILAIKLLNEKGIQKYSEELLDTLSNTYYHVNGIDSISLSKVGLTDLYPSEEEYNPFAINYVDLTISGDINARRHTTNYGNEYICKEKIEIEKLRSIDIRLLKCLEPNQNTIDEIIKKYNSLINIAISLQKLNLEIPLRDMSKGNLTIDVDKAIKTPKILIK